MNATSVSASSKDWVVGSGGDKWISNTTFDNTTLKYKNIELLNGWDPSNVVNILSGGSRNYLKRPDRKQAMRFTAPASKTIPKVAIMPCCYFPEENQPVWRIGIQADSNGLPSGTFLGSGTFGGGFIEDEKWFFTTLSPEVSATEGSAYWIVIQYDSGPEPTSSNHWLGIRAEKPTEDFMSDNIPLPYNYVGPNKNINDLYTTTVRLYDGTSWIADPGDRNLGLFILAFDDGAYYGQPYKHNYIAVYGQCTEEPCPRESGEIFTIYIQDKTVDKLEVPWNVAHPSGDTRKPADDLYYHIKENDQDGTVIAEGVFLNKEDVLNNGGAYPTQDRRWYSKTIDPPVTLEKDKTYYVYFSSPGTDETICWQSDAPNAMVPGWGSEFDDALTSITYDRDSSFVRRTRGGWPDTRIDQSRDYSFRFHLVDVYEGNLSSITKDAESIGSTGDVWKRIKLEGSVPSGTSVDIAVNSPSCGGFVTVQDNVVSGTTYDLPSCAQERYASWGLVLHTDDPSITPEIYNVTFISGAGKGISLTVTSPKNITYNNNNITISGSTNGNADISYSLNGASNVSVCNTCTSFNTWNESTNEGSNYLVIYAVNSTNSSDIDSETIYFTVDTTPPSSVTNLASQSKGETWIRWDWTNPSDPDFDHAEIWLNGTFKTNTSNYFYNATGLNISTWYEIQTRTMDSVGNINPTWVNDTARTLEDATAPTHSSNSTSSTLAGDQVEHRLKWNENVGLSGFIFSFDNCIGTFENDSWVEWSGNPTEAWSNITKTINSTVGCQIRWKVYANGTSNNWAESDIYSYMTTNNITIRLQDAEEDTYADQDNPGSEGSADVMILDLEDGSGERPYIKWNISSIPSNAKILSTRLCFYFTANYLDSDDKVEVWYVENQTWTEDEVNEPDFSNKPELTTNTVNMTGLNGSDMFHCFYDLSSDVQTELDKGHTSVSWALVSKADSGDDYANFYSKEYSNASKRPYLEISYSIENNAPYKPHNPYPSDGAINISIDTDLSWSGGDPDADDTVTYDVYFGTNTTPPLPLASENQTETTYDPGTLNYSTLYYWRIVATDNHGASNESEVWDFTTTAASDSPPLVTNPAATPATILNDPGRPRIPGTNISQLNVTVTDDTGVDTVTIDLSSIGGSTETQMSKIPGTDIWTVTTTATAGINLTHNLVVNATDISGNFNNTVSISLTVLRRGDVFRDNIIDMKDAVYITRYLAGLEPERSNPPSVLVGDVVGSGGDPTGDGIVNMKDAVYIARYKAGWEDEP